VSWVLAPDLMIACALLAGYAWLAVLSVRVRAVHRRLAAHVCGEGHRCARHRVAAAEILRREQARRAGEAAERTEPIPAVEHRHEREEGR